MTPKWVLRAWRIGVVVQLVALMWLVLMSVGDESGRLGATLLYFGLFAIPQVLANVAILGVSIWYRIRVDSAATLPNFRATFVAYLASLSIFVAAISYMLLG